VREQGGDDAGDGWHMEAGGGGTAARPGRQRRAAGAQKQAMAARRPDPDGGGEWPAHGRTIGYSGNALWRTTVAVEGGK
jgi:hypothetical protein